MTAYRYRMRQHIPWRRKERKNVRFQRGKMGKIEVFDSNGEEETFRFAEELGKRAKGGEIYCLEGDLGTGKTVFAKGFARGLGVQEVVDSPTFNIVKEYRGRVTLYHFDVYRIEDYTELQEIGFSDMLYSGGVSLIEWASQVEEEIPEEARWITIEKDLEKGFSYRKIEIGERRK